MADSRYTLFGGSQIIAAGAMEEVAAAFRELHADGDERCLLVFDDATGEQIDVDLRPGAAASPAPAAPETPEKRGPGRPKLGVVAREVTLLPRHWEWLNAQPGGASVALRKLVENARRENADSDRARGAQEATFRFMTALAGNETGFEEACRALYAGDRDRFEELTTAWPSDVAGYARALAAEAFAGPQ